MNNRIAGGFLVLLGLCIMGPSSQAETIPPEANSDESGRRIAILEADLEAAQSRIRQLERAERDATKVRRGEVMREQPLDPHSLELAWSLNDVALWLLSEQRYDESEWLFRRALVLVEQHWGPGHVARGTLLQNVGEVKWRQGDLAAASVWYREAVETFETALGRRHPRLAAALNGWATILRDQGRLEDAADLYRRAIAIYENRREGGRDTADVAAPLHNLGVLLLYQQQHEEAGKVLHRALRITEQNRTSMPDHRVVILRSLARYYAASGQLDQALMYEQKAHEQVMRYER